MIGAALAATTPSLVTSIQPTDVNALPRTERAPLWTEFAATPADRIVDTIGVATHFHYFDTAYGSHDVARLLARLGVRQIRDDVNDRSMSFYREFVDQAGPGAGVSYIIDVDNELSTAQQIRMIAARAPGTASQIESDNEPNCDGWRDGAVAALHRRAVEMRELMDSLDPLRDVPLATPSFCRNTRADYTAYGDDGVSSRFNLHPYPDGEVPGPRIAAQLIAAHAADPDSVVTVTESGYHNAVNKDGPGQRPTSELAESAYLPQMYLEYAAAGVVLTHAYELLDQRNNRDRSNPELNFGLFRSDGTIKPSGASLAALISTLTDRAGPAPDRTVSLEVSGGDAALRVQVYTRSDGSIDIAMWSVRPIWDPDRRIDLDNPDLPVTVRLPTPRSGSYVRIDGNETPSRVELPDSDTFTVPVSAHPTILRVG
jgi:hypothetical protein